MVAAEKIIFPKFLKLIEKSRYLLATMYVPIRINNSLKTLVAAAPLNPYKGTVIKFTKILKSTQAPLI